MTLLEKKLHLLKPDTSQEDISLYSTTDEVGDNYFSVQVPEYTKYYKWTSWTQPTMTSNNTLGGTDFAVWGTTGSISGKEPYYMFDNNSSTYYRGTSTASIIFYSPIALKVTNILWGVYYSYPKAGNVQGSNDGINYTTITSFTNSVNANFNIALSSNTSVYKYYKINITSVNDDVVHCSSLTITAVYAAVSTVSDYDYSEVIPVTTSYVKLAEPTYYKWMDWTCPVFSDYTAADGSVISAGSYDTSVPSYPWAAMDSVKSGTNKTKEWHNTTGNTWWKIVFPYKLKITGLTHYNRYYSGGTYCPIIGRFYADVDMTIPIGDAISTPATSWYATAVTSIPAAGIITDTIYFNKTGGNVNSGIGELEIVAQKATALPISWLQPTLSANGTLGSGTFSCSASSEYFPAWKAFNGTTTDDNDCWFSTSAPPQSIYWYSSVALNITSLQITNRNYSDNLHAVLGGIFQGSNDGSTWVDIKTFTNTVTTGNAVWSISTPNTSYFTYFRIYVTNSDGQICIGKITITATIYTGAYDFYENPLNSSSFSLLKDSVKYKLLTVAVSDYIESDFTTAGTFTWTAPANVTRIRLAMVGGGGATDDTFFSSSYSYSSPTVSSFGSYSTSTSKVTHSTNGYALGFNTTLSSGSYGKGASSVGESAGYTGNTYNGYITVISGSTYNIVVGAADTTYSTRGTSGFVKIAYGGDMQT